LDELIYLTLLNVDHLPDDGTTSPLTDFYRHNPQPDSPSQADSLSQGEANDA
jgi:hypothetical protein